MKVKNAISKRISSALDHLQNNKFEESLLNLFPALDKTAQLRFPSEGVGNRFKKFISDQWDIIAPIGLGSFIGKKCTFGGITYEEAIYKLARNHLIHEGEFNSDMSFTNNDGSIVGGRWELSNKNILALIISVISAKENKNLKLGQEKTIVLMDRKIKLDSLWGEEDSIRKQLFNSFKK